VIAALVAVTATPLLPSGVPVMLAAAAALAGVVRRTPGPRQDDRSETEHRLATVSEENP
jgi:hypothetical protein